MPLPVTLSNLLYQGVTALSLYVFALHTTVFTLTTTIPNDISPCQELVYQITVTNSAPQPQAAGQLQYCLPAGVQYVAITGLTPLNVADPRCPVFTLPALAGNASLAFELRVRVDCDAGEQGGVRDTIRITSGGVPQDPLLGSEYNIRTPVITLTPGQNWNYTGAQDDLFTRTFVLRNEGFGAVYQLFFIDTFSQAGLELLATTGVRSGDTVLLSGNTLGPNGFLAHADSVVVTQQFRLTGCPEQTLFVAFGWSCPGGETCTISKIDQYVVSSALTPAPALVVSPVGTLPVPRPCEPALLQIGVQNNGTAPALNLEWTTGLSLMKSEPVSGWTKFDCFPLDNFSVGFAALPDDAPADPFTPHHLLFSGLFTDPDGAGGLSDEDGDGQFDDLAPGQTALLSMFVGFDPACKECNELVDPRYIGAQISYTGSCALANGVGLPENVYTGISFADNRFVDDNDFLLDAGQVFEFRYDINADFTGLPGACPDDSLVLEVNLPVVLDVGAGFAPLLDGAPLPYWLKNDSVFCLLLPKPLGDLRLPLRTSCPPDIDDSAPCTEPFAPRTYHLVANMRWTCGNGCDQAVRMICLTGLPFAIDCPRPEDTTQQHGIFADSFLVRRVSLGFTDNERTTRVNPALPGLKLDTGIPFDTVLLRAFADFEGTAGDVFDSARVQLYYWNGIAEPYFYALNATLILQDAETGQTLNCSGLNVSLSALNGYHIWETDLLPLLQPGGCLDGVHLTPGDRLEVAFLARLSEQLPADDVQPVDDLRIRFPFVYHGDSLLCKMKNTDFRVINPAYSHRVEALLPQAVCDDLNVRIFFNQGASSAVDTDLFPGEIRPLNVYDTLYVLLDQGYVYQPGSAVWEYQKGDGATNVPTSAQVPLADPQAVTLPDGEAALLFLRPPGLPVTDYYLPEAPAALAFRARTLCPPDTTHVYTRLSGHRLLATVDSVNIYLLPSAVPDVDFNELALSASAVVSTDRTPTWVVQYCNPGPSFAINEPLLYVENGPALRLTGAADVTLPGAPQPLTFMQTDPTHAIVQGPLLPQNECRQIELRAEIIDCLEDTLRVLPGFQCAGAAPCVYEHPLVLYFVPKNAFAQANVTGGPGAAVRLCDPITYEITVLNVEEGPMYDIGVTLDLPLAGQTLVSGSCTATYNGNTAPLPDPLPGPGGLHWTLDFSQPPFSLNALPGIGSAPGNAVRIGFQVETDCGYIDGTRYFYQASWADACGTAKSTPQFVAPLLRIEGAPTATNSYQIQVLPASPGSICADNTFRVSIFNPGDLGPTANNEKIRMVLPGAFTYVPGSYQPEHNGPAGAPATIPFGDLNFLVFDVPPGVAAGDSMVFSVRLKNTGDVAGCAAAYDFLLQLLQTANVACDNTFCDVDFVQVEQAFTAAFEKPGFALSGLAGTSLPLDADFENWQFTFGITNTSATLPGGGALQLDIRLDNNQNGLPDPADPLVKTIAVTVEGLLPGVTQNIQETANISGLLGCSGLWVLLSDTACSCTQDQIYIPQVPVQNAGVDTVLCAGTSAGIGAPAMNGFVYQWTPASAYLSSPGIPDPQYAYTGNFGGAFLFSETLVLKTTRPQGCVSFDTLQLTTRRVEASLAAVDVSCWGDSTGAVSASIQGAQTPAGYLWNYGGSTADRLDNIPAGVFTVTVTDALGCADTASISVVQPDSLTLALDVSNYNGYGVSCAGSTDGSLLAMPAGGAGGYQFNWSVGGSGAGIGALPAGTYTLTLTDGNACSASASAAITEPPPLSALVTAADAVCPDSANGSITAVLQGGVAPYSANGQAVSGNMWVNGQLAGGMYAILLADANGCTLQTAGTVQSFFSTFAVMTDSARCFGGTDGRAEIQGSGFPPFQYTWSGGTGAGASITGPAGDYTCLATDSLGCVYPVPATIGEPPALSGQALTTPALCNADSSGQINVAAAGGTPPYGYTPAGPVIGALPAGVYAVTVTDAQGCTLTLQATVDQPAPLSLALTTTDVRCHGGSTGQIVPQAGGGVPPFSFAWSTGAGGPVLDAVPAGDYALTLSDANGCTLIGSAALVEPAAYEPEFEAVRLPCADQATGVLAVEGLPPGALYGLDRDPFSPLGLFERVGGGPHVLHIEDSLGCRFEFEYTMPTLPAELGRVLADTAIHLGDSAWLRIEINPDFPGGGLTFEWLNPDFALSGCDTCPERWVRPFGSTLFPVRFTSAEGCRSESQAAVRILRDSVYAPNVIYADASDENNRYFTLFGRPGEVVNIRYLQVFDRWGEMVFERKNFPPNAGNLGWDGAFRGKKTGPGVFVWAAEVEYVDGEIVLLRGDLTVLR